MTEYRWVELGRISLTQVAEMRITSSAALQHAGDRLLRGLQERLAELAGEDLSVRWFTDAEGRWVFFEAFMPPHLTDLSAAKEVLSGSYLAITRQ